MSKSQQAARVPGEDPQPADQDPQGGEGEDLDASQIDGGDTVLDLDKPEGADLVVDRIQRGRATLAAPAETGKLPSPASIDTDKLERPVLTNEGWLVSTKQPAKLVGLR
jgi:hypothetical protein